MHWWQMWLGTVGAAIVMSFWWPPVELAKYARDVLAEMREDKEMPWYFNLLVLASLVLMVITITGYWLGGFLMLSFAGGWKMSAYIAFFTVAVLALQRWSDRRFAQREDTTQKQ